MKRFYFKSILAFLFVLTLSITSVFAAYYMLDGSDNRLIAKSELLPLTEWELKVARNEIYARHGRKFSHQDLKCYFERLPWYTINPRFSDSQLNKVEQKNVQTILAYEKSLNSPFLTKDLGCMHGKAMANAALNADAYDVTNDHYYLLPHSGTQMLSKEDLYFLTDWGLKAARNEIYARHGRKFSHQDLKCYFDSTDWYHVNPNYSDTMLNKYEKANAAMILSYEKEIKSSHAFVDKGCNYQGEMFMDY